MISCFAWALQAMVKVGPMFGALNFRFVGRRSRKSADVSPECQNTGTNPGYGYAGLDHCYQVYDSRRDEYATTARKIMLLPRFLLLLFLTISAATASTDPALLLLLLLLHAT